MKFLIMAALIAVAIADSAYTTYPVKGYEYPAHPYKFAYQVKDDYSYNNFGHQKTSDGKVTSGSYNVLLPDGRTQTVTYKDDGYSGYIADVKYDGHAKPYEYKTAYKTAYPSPSY